MEYRIAHVCGHEQAHYLSGFSSQMDRKAAWLRTTKCKSCFVAEKRLEQADAAAGDSTAISHLDLVALTGSDRQVAWASTIRAKRLAAIIAAAPPTGPTDPHACYVITDAKWWIDHRDLSDADLLAKAAACAATSYTKAPIMIMAQSV
jgi:hypothetical protein